MGTIFDHGNGILRTSNIPALFSWEIQSPPKFQEITMKILDDGKTLIVDKLEVEFEVKSCPICFRWYKGGICDNCHRKNFENKF